MIKINPGAYSSVFVLPRELADRHLKLCGTIQLKTLIYIYSRANEELTLDGISKAVGFSPPDVADAVSYWIESGLIIDTERFAPDKHAGELIPMSVQEKSNAAPDSRNNSRLPAREAVIKPPPAQIAARASEDVAVREMFSDAQRILGRTIGYDTQAALLTLHDHYGLPAEVIIMICEYARRNQKSNNTNYISHVAKDWAAREIDTFQKAVEELERLDSRDKLWGEFAAFAKLPGVITKKQNEFFSVWTNDWAFGLEMLCLAYEETVDHSGKFSLPYMNSILKAWFEKGINTPGDALRDKREWQEKNTVKSRGKAPKTKEQTFSKVVSYDIGKAEEKAKQDELVYKKRGEG